MGWDSVLKKLDANLKRSAETFQPGVLSDEEQAERIKEGLEAGSPFGAGLSTKIAPAMWGMKKEAQAIGTNEYLKDVAKANAAAKWERIKKALGR